MSNRLTFSLASLILILALGLVAMPVIAHDGHTDAHPAVSITAAPDSEYTDTDAKARDNFKVKITFSIGGSTDSDRFTADLLEAADLAISGFNAGGGLVASAGVVKSGITFADTRVDADKHEWIVPLQIDANDVRKLRVEVQAGTVTGAHADSQQPNEVASMDFDSLPSVTGLKAALSQKQAKNAADEAIQGRYTITLTLTDGDKVPTAPPTPLPTTAEIKVTPEGAANPISGTNFVAGTTVGVYTVDYQLGFGYEELESVELKLIDGYATNAPILKLPPKPSVKQNPPMAEITAGEHDEEERSYRLTVTFTPTAASDGSDGKDIKVGMWDTGKNEAAGTFDPDKHLSITNADDLEVLTTVEADRGTDNSYVAILKYDRLSDTPLTITFATDDKDKLLFPLTGDTPSAQVGEDDEEEDEDDPPTAEIVVSRVDTATSTFRVDVTLTPGDKADGTAGDDITDFGLDDLEITDAADSDVTITPQEERTAKNSYRASLKWGALSDLPLTIKAVLEMGDDDTDTVYYKDTSDPTEDAMATVDTERENAAPVFKPTAATSITGVVGTAIATVDVSATDADGDTLTYSWDVADEAALGLALDTATGMITGTPLKAHDMEHTVTVTDGTDSATHTIQVTITDPANNDPVFNADAPDSITGVVGTAIATVDVSATDADGDTLTYSWDVADEAALGLALDTATGMITGTPLKAHDMEHTVTVMDGNGGSATHTIQVTITAVANNPPFFQADASIEHIIIWQGHAYDDSDPLPKARDNEGDSISYKIVPDLPPGFELLADDTEDRFIEVREVNKGATVVQAATEYELVAVDNKGAESDPSVKFNITVLAPIAPSAPTSVTAMEEGDLGYPENIARTINSNKVVVAWVAPVDTTVTSHVPAIPFGSPITGYKVYQNHEDLNEVVYPRTGDDPIKADATGHKTPVLNPPGPTGTYDFEVAAVNAVGDGAKSAPVAPALVANPPGAPRDLRASKVPSDPNSVTLDWLLPASDGGTPILGYIIYQTLDGGPEITVEIAPAVTHRLTDLDAGRHVFRVAAVNYDGLGNRSEGTEFSVDIPPDPTDPVNVKPTFGNETIDNITATVGTPIESVTLPAATDPDGDDGDITYSLLPNPAAVGLTFNASTRFLSGTPTRAQSARAYTYTARDAKGGTAHLNFTLTVNAAPQPPRPTPTGDLDATYLNGVTTIHSGSIGMNGFATIGSQSLPDLEEFFDLGGTIGLADNDTADDANSRTIVISEILWGNDLGAPVEQQKKWQFIELYNTTGAPITVTGWTLTFTPGRPVPAIDIDQVSNRSGAGWNLDKGGNHGQTGRVTGTLATDLESAITPTNIISMYRNINYEHVEKHTGNRGELVKGIPGGNGSGSWKASQRRSEYNRWIYDSKRDKHFKATPILTASAVARSPFIINEIGNGAGDTNDWVEIRNVTDAEASLKNYHLSYVSGFDMDTSLVNFHDKDIKVPGKGVILLVNTDPKNTGIAAGRNAAVADADQELTGVTSRYYINSNLKLPDDGKFNLILRNAHDKLKASSHFMDVVGGLVVADATKGTSLWPLVATGGPHGDVIEANGRDLKSPRVYIRKNAGGGTGEHHLGVVGYTGVGYDRVTLKSDANGGTPGYDNGAVKEKVADLIAADSSAEITISEIMLESRQGRQNLPQWIELYNSSMTHSVNTNGWKLHVENANDVDTALDSVLTLDSMTIAPNQTILIVTNSGRVSDPDHFPSHRLVNLWTTKKHRDALEMVRRTDQVFSTTGLYLKLTDKDNKLVDEAGNLDGNRRTRDEPNWTIPMGEDDDRRSSLIRVYDAGVAVTGTTAAGWVLADSTNLAFAISQTYYGDADDFGTPGFRGGGPVPVSLSKFRPERSKDTGEIVVRWITESELNNAGFNILRSEKRDSEFTKVHFQAGQGTTSERTAYEWKDTTAKPNVVYYYQIQDVSLDGDVTTLRTTHLRGNVTATGKATTTWGRIKALQ